MKSIERLCADDREATSLLDAALKGEQPRGRPEINSKNLTNKTLPPRGYETRSNLRRLRKDKPELHDRVIAGELTPHKAMVEAGFLPKRRNVNMDDPVSAAATIKEHMSADNIADLIALLVE